MSSRMQVKLSRGRESPQEVLIGITGDAAVLVPSDEYGFAANGVDSLEDRDVAVCYKKPSREVDEELVRCAENPSA